MTERLPTLALLTRSAADVRGACERLLPALAAFAGSSYSGAIAPCASQIGSGSLPVDRLASSAVVLAPAGDSKRTRGAGRALEALARRLRALPVPVIGRVHDGALWLDLRCLTAADEARLLRQLQALPPC